MRKAYASTLLAVTVAVATSYALPPDQIALLEDSSGWEIMKLTDIDSGVPTTHVCFDGNGQGACRGTLVFHPDGTFVQKVFVHGQQLGRQGKYEVGDGGILFYDEFGYKDGPYAATFDVAGKGLTLQTQQAVQVRMDLLLESEYRRRLLQKSKNQQHR